MARRIIGQCNTADFRYLEHLSDLRRRGEQLDLTNLTNRQKVAVIVLKWFQECGVSFDVLLKVKEVLVWQFEDGRNAFEYKLLNPYDSETWAILRTMNPVKGGRRV